MAKHKRYNPERRWHGRSYKKGDAKIKSGDDAAPTVRELRARQALADEEKN